MSDFLDIAETLEDLAQRLRNLEMGDQPDLPPGRLLARARNEANLSQHRLSELSGVATNTIINFEKGKSKPRERTLMALAEQVDIPWYWLLEEEDA